MKGRSLAEVAVTISPDSEEAVLELGERCFGHYPTLYTDAETGQTSAHFYLPLKAWSPAVRRQLQRELRKLQESGFARPGPLRVRRLRHADWAHSWKRHFKPIRVGGKLLIKPSWDRSEPRAGQATVVLDPGLSFGTGQHPTTRFCLGELTRLRRRFSSPGFLDVGTGSGILAIAAAKLGYDPVVAFDFDPQAVATARANARRNRVRQRVRIERADLTRLPAASRKRYEVLCANLIFDLLLSERERLSARLAPGGVLILAGILASQFERVQQAFERAGFRLERTAAQKEWKSGSFLAP